MLLTVFVLSIWGVGTLVAAALGLAMHLHPIRDQDRRRGARMMLLSPLWPCVIPGFLMQVWRAAFGGDHA